MVSKTRNVIQTLILLLLLCNACNRNASSYQFSSIKTDTLTTRETKLDTSLFLPRAMDIVGSNLVITLDRAEKAFLIFPLPLDGKGTLSGPIGRGPMDFLGVDPYGITSTDDGFIACDRTGMKTCKIKDNEVIVENTDRNTANCCPINGLAKAYDSFIDMAVMPSEKEFIMYDAEGKEKNRFSDFPEWSTDTETEKTFLYMKMWRMHPDKDRIAAFYVHFNKLRILDLSGKVHYESDTYLEAGSDVKEDMKRLCFYTKPCVNEKRIAAMKDLDKMSEIQIWDWKGKMLQRLIIPQKVTLFTIDWKTGIIYLCNDSTPGIIYSAEMH